MKILLIHNRYTQYGGEDSVFEVEQKLLSRYNHEVHTVIFDNAIFDKTKNKIPYLYKTVFNRNSQTIVAEAVENFKPDVIHIHNIFYLASPAILFAINGRKIPIIYTLHNYRLICAAATLMRDSVPCELCVRKTYPFAGVIFACHRNSRIQTMQLMLITGIHKTLGTWRNRVTKYIALTEFARNKFIHSSLSIGSEQIEVKPNSVDDLGATSRSERQDFYLFVGRLSTEKGIDVLLKAFSSQKRILKIIGDGPLKEVVMKTCAENPNIIFVGRQNKEYIIAQLKMSKALIVPSIWYEGLPTTILESFSTGTPVIISNLDNLNTIVTDNLNGKHFETNNPVSLVRAIEVFENSETSKLYLNARKTFLEKYTHEANYERLMTIYESAVDSLKP